MKNYNIANLIVTNGKSGCSFYSNGKKMNINCISVNCLDVTGAGDSFMASFIWANEFGFDVLNSILFANASAAYSVTKQLMHILQIFMRFYQYCQMILKYR